MKTIITHFVLLLTLCAATNALAGSCYSKDAREPPYPDCATDEARAQNVEASLQPLGMIVENGRYDSVKFNGPLAFYSVSPSIKAGTELKAMDGDGSFICCAKITGRISATELKAEKYNNNSVEIDGSPAYVYHVEFSSALASRHPPGMAHPFIRYLGVAKNLNTRRIALKDTHQDTGNADDDSDGGEPPPRISGKAEAIMAGEHFMLFGAGSSESTRFYVVRMRDKKIVAHFYCYDAH
jgi:hypothetical protein